ncbi:MAG: hypothetical protein K6F04_01640 [bacterium]|nr:hypothetical protein [bacterium]
MKLRKFISTTTLLLASTPVMSSSSISMCVACEAGTYSAGGTATTCTPCPAGQYQNQTGATSCKSCPAGTYSKAGSTSCTKCPAGYTSLEGAKTCSALSCSYTYTCTGQYGAGNYGGYSSYSSSKITASGHFSIGFDSTHCTTDSAGSAGMTIKISNGACSSTTLKKGGSVSCTCGATTSVCQVSFTSYGYYTQSSSGTYGASVDLCKGSSNGTLTGRGLSIPSGSSASVYTCVNSIQTLGGATCTYKSGNTNISMTEKSTITDTPRTITCTCP